MLIRAVIALLLIALLAACSGESSRSRADGKPAAAAAGTPANHVFGSEERIAPSKIILLLIDRSDSVRKPDIRAKYITDSRTVVSSLNHGDAIVVAPISDRSARELELPVNDEIPRFDPGTDNELLVKAKKRQAGEELSKKKDAIANRIGVLLQTESRIPRTDILGSMELAARVFDSVRRDRKVLVIMSDMIEDSSRYNFERENLTSTRIESILDQLRQQKGVANLTDVRVFVTGAMAPDDRRYRQIRDFWMAYFKAAGAKIRDADYGTSLIRLPVD